MESSAKRLLISRWMLVIATAAIVGMVPIPLMEVQGYNGPWDFHLLFCAGAPAQIIDLLLDGDWKTPVGRELLSQSMMLLSLLVSCAFVIITPFTGGLLRRSSLTRGIALFIVASSVGCLWMFISFMNHGFEVKILPGTWLLHAIFALHIAALAILPWRRTFDQQPPAL